MIHVGMNLADKAGVFGEVRRVLKAVGVFALFEIMRGSAKGAMRYPVPWALSEQTSFVSDAKDYRKMLEQAGFRILQERNRREFAIEFMNRTMPRTTASAPPVLGIQLLMGDKTGEMLKNTLTMIEEGVLSPWSCTRRACSNGLPNRRKIETGKIARALLAARLAAKLLGNSRKIISP
jgi:hypothetical protein